MPSLTYAALAAWLARRRVRILVRPGLAALPPLPRGLVLAAGDVPRVPVDVAPDNTLRRAQISLFSAASADDGAPRPATVSDASVRALRTADDVREAATVVQLLQRAILSGTALDRIAVVVPDARTTEPLARAFLRASISATFLVARPIRALPIASLVQALVDVAAGDERAIAIASLLLHPATILAGLAGGDRDALLGRARFRTLLGPVRDMAAASSAWGSTGRPHR